MEISPRWAADLPGAVVVAQVGREVMARKVVVVDDLPPGVLCARVDGVVYARPSVAKPQRKRGLSPGR